VTDRNSDTEVLAHFIENMHPNPVDRKAAGEAFARLAQSAGALEDLVQLGLDGGCLEDTLEMAEFLEGYGRHEVMQMWESEIGLNEDSTNEEES